jgi:3-methyladenine DNA glycosylase AlkC
LAELLKHLYNQDLLGRLAGAVQAAGPDFSAQRFLRDVFGPSWDELELKARMRHVSTLIGKYLPGDYRRQLMVLERIAPDFRGFTAMVFPDFVEVFGLDDYAPSVSALEHFTPFSSSEFAVRPFIVRYERDMMRRMSQWAAHRDPHVRRLASEGCRPRLPWAVALPRFKADPTPVLHILEALKADESDYVRRSVANNLNDIAKDHPDVTLAVAERWYGSHPDTDALVKHACRTLLKQGDPNALALFGYDTRAPASLTELRANRTRLRIGESLEFSFCVEHRQEAPLQLRLEYTVHFVKANGGTSKKVFQIAERTLPAGQETFTRTHAFRDLSTRTHYPGEHRIAVVLNGVEQAGLSVTLVR